MKFFLSCVLVFVASSALSSTPPPPPFITYDLDLVRYVTIACFDDTTCKNKDMLLSEIPALKPFADFLGTPYTPAEGLTSNVSSAKWPSGTVVYDNPNFLYPSCRVYVSVKDNLILGLSISNYTYKTYAQFPGGKLNACKLKVDLNT